MGMFISKRNALLATLLAGASALPLWANAAETSEALAEDKVENIIVVGQKNTPITVKPRGLSVSLGREEFEKVNALNVEDLMKYTPNFFVRKRFAGDDNAVVAMRGANTVQSARTIVLVDGFLVSNFLGNRFDFPPKWNVVGPSEIRQFDIVYGPYSARYNGNSMGGVVSITTDEPKANGGYATIQKMIMPFKEYGFDETFEGYSFEGGLTWKPEGSRLGLRASYRHFENVGQSMTYNLLSRVATQPTSASVQATYTDVKGAYVDPRLATPVFGAQSPVDVVQDQARLRASYDLGAGWKADGLLVWWKSSQDLTDARTWLTATATGLPVYQGRVKFNGVYYNATGITHSTSERTEYLAGGRVSGPWGGWDVRANLSRFWIAESDGRASNDFLTGLSSGAGRQTLQDTPGWWAFDASMRQAFGAHDITFGVNQNLYKAGQTIYSVTNWRTAANATYNSGTFGKTSGFGVFVEDEISLSDRTELTLGVRADRWRAFDGGLGGLNSASQKVVTRYDTRSQTSVDPKLSLQTRVSDTLSLQLSLGTATRFPTVGELYQGTFDPVAQIILPDSFDPNLKAEKSKDISLIARRKFARSNLTLSAFGQDIDDAIFSFQGINQYGNTVSNYKNIARMKQYGVEVIYEAKDFLITGLDLNGSVSWMDAKTVENPANRAAEGVQFPRIPRWRSNGSLTYAFTEKLKGTMGWRYASRPNSDLFGLSRGRAFGFQSEYNTYDLKVNYAVNSRTQVSVGIDNVANYQAYVSHPLPQRTVLIELKYRQ